MARAIDFIPVLRESSIFSIRFDALLQLFTVPAQALELFNPPAKGIVADMSGPETSSHDAALQQAIAHQQAGRLPEAEQLYRSILQAKPEHAAANHNLGFMEAQRGNAQGSLPLLRLALETDPGQDRYWLSYAAALLATGQAAAARGVLEQGRQHGLAGPGFEKLLAQIQQTLDAGIIETQMRQGNELMRQGKAAEAASVYRGALQSNPDSAQLLNNLGTALLNQDKLEEAETAYTQALAIKPDYAGTHYNLGNIFLRQNKLDQAVASYRQALQIDPNNTAACNNLGNALERQGKLDEAQATYQRALAIRPDNAQAVLNYGNVLLRQEKVMEAEPVYRRVLELAPGLHQAYYNLGLTLCESNRVPEGFSYFTRSAELTFRPPAQPPLEQSPPHRQRHDQEQKDYWASIGEETGRAYHLADGARLATPAVNPDNRAGVAERWQASNPQLVVIDNLLTPEALEKLRRFLWGSTIWKRPYDDGYIGAMPEHGVACPLLAQIADELRDIFPSIFHAHPLHYLWAYKYDSQLTGIRIHADQAAVNVNFWITPDDANLDADHGGLVVWDKSAPLDWQLTKYNGDEAASREFLAKAGAKPITIPYRANRAVVFDSDLFHETDKISFKEGYLNRRINVTLLYGRRNDPIVPH